MIFRTYLPYRSAREYTDRGMAKWMGFFISEHTTALSEMGNEIDFSKQMDLEKIVILLSQVYLNELDVEVYTKDKLEPLIGKIIDLANSKIYFKRHDGVIRIFSYDEILRIIVLEEDSEQV